MEFSGTSDNYERNLAVLKGLPDVATAGPSTINPTTGKPFAKRRRVKK